MRITNLTHKRDNGTNNKNIDLPCIALSRARPPSREEHAGKNSSPG